MNHAMQNPTGDGGARALAGRVAATVLAVVSVLGLAIGLPAAGAAAVTRADLYYGQIPPGHASAATGTAASTDTATAAATQAQAQGVVLINTELPNGSAAGTGMVLSADGTVLTNYHVVEGSTEIQATLAGTGQTWTAQVIGHDASKDVAVLRLQGAQGLTPVRIDPDGVQAGETVTAVGNANGAQQLVQATGQVTDPTSQVTASTDGTGSGSETLTDVFQTSVAAQPGDSGGPMYDAQGEVVGMTTAGSSSNGSTGRYRQTSRVVATESYAVNISDALAVVRQVTSGAESGTVRIGANAYLGVQLQGTGLTLAGVVDGTPAAAAGLEEGDTLTGINQTQVASNSELSAALAQLEPGQQVTVSYLDQSGAGRQTSLTLGSSPVN